MPPSPAILAADTNDRNLQLLSQFLGRAGFIITSVTTLDALDAALEQIESGYDLALIDLSGFDENIWNCCDRLNQHQIPWLGVCLANQENTMQQEGYRHGTRGLLVKPLSIETLVNAVRSVLEGNT